MTWILFILFYCGPGCVEVTARSYRSYEACNNAMIVASDTVTYCEKWIVQ